MALLATALTVSTTSLALSAAAQADGRVGHTVVIVNTGSSTVYLGPSGVTAAVGYPLDAAGQLAIDLDPGDRLYGICSTGQTTTVRLLQQGT